jgi:hypothetical protein
MSKSLAEKIFGRKVLDQIAIERLSYNESFRVTVRQQRATVTYVIEMWSPGRNDFRVIREFDNQEDCACFLRKIPEHVHISYTTKVVW